MYYCNYQNTKRKHKRTNGEKTKLSKQILNTKNTKNVEPIAILVKEGGTNYRTSKSACAHAKQKKKNTTKNRYVCNSCIR